MQFPICSYIYMFHMCFVRLPTCLIHCLMFSNIFICFLYSFYTVPVFSYSVLMCPYCFQYVIACPYLFPMRFLYVPIFVTVCSCMFLIFSYAQTLILVNSMVVHFISVLDITRNHVGISGPYQDTSFLSSPRTSPYPPGT